MEKIIDAFSLFSLHSKMSLFNLNSFKEGLTFQDTFFRFFI